MTAPPRSRFLFPVVVVLFLFASHWPFVSLPFFWDELGQFVPASLDIYQHRQFVPTSTLPNVHPPGLMAYLSGVWLLTGFSIAISRLAVLFLAALSLGAVWSLGDALKVEPSPRRLAVALLLVSPLFYTQSMMVQLELPALLFSTSALALFLKGRYGWSAVACAALVLMKETGALVPVLLAGWLLWRRDFRHAALFAWPLAVLAGWLAFLRAHTGEVLGNQEFARYNLFYPLHPVRLIASLLRRGCFLFGSSFHWVGTWALIASRAQFVTPAWGLAAAFALLHTVEVSVLGGATLERYLLPVFPVLYLAMAAALWRYAWIWRVILPLGLTGSLWINPPYPFPFENNLAFTDFVLLQKSAASYLESVPPREPIATAWPFTDALSRPEFGYVTRRHQVEPLEDFRLSQLAEVRAQTLVVYTRTWESAGSVLHSTWVRGFLHRFYQYEPAADPPPGWTAIQSFDRRGQRLTIYLRGAR